MPALPDATGPALTQRSGTSATGPTARGRRKPRRWGSPWGSLQGGLGVCLIVGSTAIGAIATMAMGSAPGFLLGVFVIIGTVVAALAVRPRAGRVILPVPVLSYLVAALVSGVIYNRSADSSRAALAIGAAQWVASGFFAMAIATLLAVAIITLRWYLWRRGRRAARDPGWPGAGPTTFPAGRSGSRGA